MDRYKVTDPNGVLLGKDRIAKGDFLPQTGATGSQVKAWLRFNQIEKVEEKKAPVAPPKPPAETAAQKKAREEAEKKAAEEDASK